MFEKIAGSLQKILRDLRGFGRLSERNIQDALREVRIALLEADVNYQVVRDFIGRVKEKCLGKEVLESITPGQQVVKHVHDELAALLGGTSRDFDFTHPPARVLLLGLNGAGKTTTAAKLALRWKKAGRRVLLVACDLRRPAAVDQLVILGRQVGVEVLPPEPGDAIETVGRRALARAESGGFDTLLFDTGGRFQIDSELVQELKDLKAAVEPRNVVLVLDAAIGQESVNVAETFNKEAGLTGLILTKLDGDARGGAALSVQAVAKCPILLVGTGERMGDLEPFHPERMASRILGMGDVVTLVEKAQESLDAAKMADMQKKILDNDFTLDDFLDQIQQIRKLGPVENLLDMLPGAARIPEQARKGLTEDSGAQWKRAEAIIRSMTPDERRNPLLMDASRRRRVARGSGTQVQDVNELLKNFERARDMARQLRKTQKRLNRFRK